MLKEKHYVELKLWLIPMLIAACLGGVFLYSATKTQDRFTGTQGAVLAGAVSAIQSDIVHMEEMQEKAWARIECRQIVFITAANRETKDFKELLEGCK